MANIYEITGDILRVMDLFAAEEIDEETARDTLESLKYDLENKAVGYCKAIKNMESEKLAIKSEIERLSGRAKTLDNTIERMKQTLFQAMEATETNKIKNELFSISIGNRAPQLPSNIEDYKIPKKYYIEQQPKLDKKTLLSDIKAGEVENITVNDLYYGRGLNIR